MNDTSYLIEYEPGSVGVNYTKAAVDYDLTDLWVTADTIKNHLNNIKVDNDNIKGVKSILAKVNKYISEIDSRRISIKRDILTEYTAFESELKELTGYIKEIDGTVRAEVRRLENIEKDLKKEKLKNIFYKRLKHYDFHFVTFDVFFKERYLNKSVSILEYERELISLLETVKEDLKIINGSPDRDDLLFYYKKDLDIKKAILQVQADKDIKAAAIEDTDETDSTDRPDGPVDGDCFDVTIEGQDAGESITIKPMRIEPRTMDIKIRGDRDIKRALDLFETYGISYTIL